VPIVFELCQFYVVLCLDEEDGIASNLLPLATRDQFEVDRIALMKYPCCCSHTPHLIIAEMPRLSHSEALLGPELFKLVRQTPILVVGAGGIGCELRKSTFLLSHLFQDFP